MTNMVGLNQVHLTIEIIVGVATFGGVLHSLWRGTLRDFIESLKVIESMEATIQNLPSLIEQVEEMYDNDVEMRHNIREIRSQQEVIKNIQVAQSMAINDGKQLNIDSIRKQHFGEEVVAEDFLDHGTDDGTDKD